MPARKLLILGGTGEAAALARAVPARFGDRLRVTSSLAGRTRHPAALAGDVRAGGFGGAAGLARYLADDGVHMVIDATHPFAATISRHGREACDALDLPRLTLARPAWRKQPGDRWIEVDDAAAAARALAAHGGRALITIGIRELAPFAGLQDPRCLVRLIELPPQPLPFDLITGRGPFTVAAEKRLFMDRRIDVLVTKASGGAATRAKITAARVLGLPVIMIRRPPEEPGPKARTIAAALDWLGVNISK
ncbi:MAG: cobalt-precorrin-6A reductase [Proteobacteria bacterium]|nr:cobalt-precorrin-6A reductase [Pseudomonadota bacterium]